MLIVVENWKERTQLSIGKKNVELLNQKHVLVAGLGGVGGYAAENICRAGIGEMTIVDADIVNESNINRQIIALRSTTGKSKAEVMSHRLLDINPQLKVNVVEHFIEEEFAHQLLSKPYDYVIDAIDTLSPKLSFILTCLNKQLPLVSSMGAGGKFDPSLVQVADISKSYNCRLAKMIRKRLHKRGIYKGFKVVFSPEDVDGTAIVEVEGEDYKRSMVGTISYMPPVFGCFCTSVVVRDLINR